MNGRLPRAQVQVAAPGGSTVAVRSSFTPLASALSSIIPTASNANAGGGARDLLLRRGDHEVLHEVVGRHERVVHGRADLGLDRSPARELLEHLDVRDDLLVDQLLGEFEQAGLALQDGPRLHALRAGEQALVYAQPDKPEEVGI